MKLFSLPFSPFAARCRMQIYAKDIPVSIEAPPGGFRSDSYAAINPLRKVPALDTGDGVIPESDTIMEFLEDHFPEPPLRPSGALARSRARLLTRIADLYVMEPMLPLFTQIDSDRPDKALIARQLEKIEWGIRQLDHHIGTEDYAVGDRLSTADCALVPVLLYVTTMLPLFGMTEPLRFRERLAAYWENVQSDPLAQRVIGEIRDGLAGLQKKAGA